MAMTHTSHAADAREGNRTGACDTGAGSQIIFFDGVCGMCNRMVDFVLARDARRAFRFAPLQGSTSRQLLGEAESRELNSVVLVTPSGRFSKSEAVWRIMWQLGGLWKVPALALRCVPRALRDLGYGFVARHRYRWFGKKETCRLPTAEQRARFLS